MYEKELKAIKRSGRYRQRKLFDASLEDLASNDYLGLASNEELFKRAYERVLNEHYHSPKASMLVNGYSNIHKEFEDRLCEVNGFEEGLIVGSGFLANISMIEALVRKGDVLLIDEEYHASGMLSAKLVQGSVVVFKHNDINDLKKKISSLITHHSSRIIIAIEGVYSMEGDIAPKEIFDIADEHGAILIVDEAHSSGVIGDELLGIFDHYKIEPKKNHIKMGTLGKAYGSYGAYILASAEIIEFLVNRAKPVIYSTAPSLFDTALGLGSLEYIIKYKEPLKKEIKIRQEIVKEILGIDPKSLIIPVEIGSNKRVLEIQEKLKNEGFVVGAIRQPTVKSAIVRLIAKIDVRESDLKRVCEILNSEKEA